MSLASEGRNKPHCTSLTSLQISESFQHFRSVSYFEAVKNSKKSAEKPRMPSNSTPCTPKRIEIDKYSTLPSGLPSTFSGNKKSRSLSSFFRRLRPKLRHSKHPWIVIEFASSQDVSSDSSSSDPSIELALRSKSQHFTSLKELNGEVCPCRKDNHESQDSSLRTLPQEQYKSEGSIFGHLSPKRRLENLKHVLRNFSKRPSASMHSLRTSAQNENDRFSPSFINCAQQSKQDFLTSRHSADIGYLLRIRRSRSSNGNLASVLEDRAAHDQLQFETRPPPKLPSYVSISCAINGYANYSAFCRSQSPHRKGSLDQPAAMPATRYSRSQSDCNGSITLAQQINLQTTRTFVTEINLKSTITEESAQPTPAAEPLRLSLAREVGGEGGKSLVQQRIESLYGGQTPPSLHLHKARRQLDDQTPTPPPTPHTGGSPPVFRHLNKDFRKQLQITNGHDTCDRVTPKKSPLLNQSEERAGHHYLRLIEQEREKIIKQVRLLECETEDVPEEAGGMIRAACGKANLLITQKFAQFAQLCTRNIEEPECTPFYPTPSDLAGFWDLVQLQIGDVHSAFTRCWESKHNGWVTTPPTIQEPVPRVKVKCRSAPSTPKRSQLGGGARDESRKQLLLAKRRAAAAAAKQQGEEVTIFLPP